VLELDSRFNTTILVDLPALVIVDGLLVDYSVIADPERDLGFRSVVTGADLPFDIERWNPGGESLVWIKVPRVEPGIVAASVAVHFGPGMNRYAGTGADVWSDYAIALHGERFPDGATHDRVTLGAGWIGNGLAFPSTGDGVVAMPPSTLLDGWPSFSLEMWLLVSGMLPSGTEPAIIDTGSALRLGRTYRYGGLDEAFAFQIDVAFANSTTFYGTTFVLPDLWTHIIYTFDGDSVRVYRNGVLANFGAVETTTTGNGANALVLGKVLGAFTGGLDEIRITRRSLSADEARARYESDSGRLFRRSR